MNSTGTSSGGTFSPQRSRPLAVRNSRSTGNTNTAIAVPYTYWSVESPYYSYDLVGQALCICVRLRLANA